MLSVRRKIYLQFVTIKLRHALAIGLIGVVPALTGCISHTRIVPKTRLADVVMSTSLDEMSRQLNARFEAIQTMNASVTVAAITGGGLQGKEKEYTSLGGYIFMRKPANLRVLLRVPVLGSTALDMVTDGTTFKLLIPRYNRAMVGTNEVTKPSKNGLENLRPAVFFDSLFVQGQGPNQILSMTTDTRVVQSENKKELIEEPAYELHVLAQPEGQTVRTLRVIHINSTDLLPFQQDIYDKDGQVVTKALYSNYRFYGDIPFPSTIVIQRPRDHYSLTVTIVKLTLNQKLEDDQFELKIPDNIPIQKMN
jgi:outer membrane lipoprotein-sorting protein